MTAFAFDWNGRALSARPFLLYEPFSLFPGGTAHAPTDRHQWVTRWVFLILFIRGGKEKRGFFSPSRVFPAFFSSFTLFHLFLSMRDELKNIQIDKRMRNFLQNFAFISLPFLFHYDKI